MVDIHLRPQGNGSCSVFLLANRIEPGTRGDLTDDQRRTADTGQSRDSMKTDGFSLGADHRGKVSPRRRRARTSPGDVVPHDATVGRKQGQWRTQRRHGVEQTKPAFAVEQAGITKGLECHGSPSHDIPRTFLVRFRHRDTGTERVIDPGLTRRLDESRETNAIGRRRIGVRLADNRRHPSNRRRPCRVRVVLFVGLSRVPDVNVSIDDTGEYDQASRVDDFPGVSRLSGFGDADDPTVGYGDVGVPHSAGQDAAPILDE